ncbi:MAG: hypothetical protein LBU79_00680 [Planctomycetota bacterium]|jgi:hypothetical protein|nr:hypothetical protein [Planctomycetota bacterium]
MSFTPEEQKRQLESTEPYHVRAPLDDFARAARRRNYREFIDRFKYILHVTRETNLFLFQNGDQEYFTELFSLFFSVMEKPSVRLEENDLVLFALGGNLTNLLNVTPHRNGDDCIRKILAADGNLAKVLLLYSPRSHMEMPLKNFFDANPFLTSLWYGCVWNWTDCYVDAGVEHMMKFFMDNFDPRFEVADSNLIVGYFRCTYVDNMNDRKLKRNFNASVRKFCSDIKINNRPNPRSLAVVTSYWNQSHAVYRAFGPYLAELAKHYDLTLVNLTERQPHPPDTSLFKRTIDIVSQGTMINVSGIVDNDFQAAYYPDVGMSPQSLYLSNLRIAPIQAMSTGHPVSSTSQVMDYFISGSTVETASNPEDNYDERLVLLPGLSVHPAKPVYSRHNPPPESQFIINCPWMHMKNNLPMARNLRKVADMASRPIVFNIFPGCGATTNCSFMSTIQDYSQVLPPDKYSIVPDLPYERYMLKLEAGRFALHSYPFGGGTTAVDSLFLGKPLVVLRGRHEYNRYSAAILERLGLTELIADNQEEWLEIVLRLINNPDYLDEITQRVEALDLDNAIFRLDDADNLRRAFDMLIRRDAELKADSSHTPLRVE